MKTFILLLSIVLLSGCSSAGVGAGLRAMGGSMQESAKNNRTINCTTTNYGYAYNTNCRGN